MKQDENNNFYCNSISSARESSDFDFIKWFNGGDSEEGIVYSGYHSFLFQIFTPLVKKYLKKYENCLEIGVGGGRIANASSKFFRNFYGIDIHDNLEDTKKWLISKGGTNINLKKVDSCEIPFEDKKFDLIYSFIVFQHVMNPECVSSYLREIYRTLSDGGLAVIFVGRPKFLWKIRRCNLFAKCDYFIESLFSLFGKNVYKNEKALVNHVNLDLSRRYMIKLLKELGLEILEIKYSNRSDNLKKIGGQRGFVIGKNIG